MNELQKIIEEMRTSKSFRESLAADYNWADRLDALLGEPVAIVVNGLTGENSDLHMPMLPIGTKLYAIKERGE